MYIGIFGTIIVALIAIYLATKKKEPEITKDLIKKEKTFLVKEPEIKEPEKTYNHSQSQPQGLAGEKKQPESDQPESDQSKVDSEPPFQSPSEPEVL